jgi:hypothetical protein
MPRRKATWAILAWTAFMGVGMFAPALGIGGDCVSLTGNDVAACQANAWVRGGIGLALLLFLWFVGFVPLASVWFLSRSKENVAVYGPAGELVLLSADEARKRVDQPGLDESEATT